MLSWDPGIGNYLPTPKWAKQREEKSSNSCSFWERQWNFVVWYKPPGHQWEGDKIQPWSSKWFVDERLH